MHSVVNGTISRVAEGGEVQRGFSSDIHIHASMDLHIQMYMANPTSHTHTSNLHTDTITMQMQWCDSGCERRWLKGDAVLHM